MSAVVGGYKFVFLVWIQPKPDSDLYKQTCHLCDMMSGYEALTHKQLLNVGYSGNYGGNMFFFFAVRKYMLPLSLDLYKILLAVNMLADRYAIL